MALRRKVVEAERGSVTAQQTSLLRNITGGISLESEAGKANVETVVAPRGNDGQGEQHQPHSNAIFIQHR